MARLPTTLQPIAPRGASLDPRVVRAGGGLADGLQDLGQAVQALGEAQMARDDKKAQRVLQAAQAAYEPQFGERAAAYDGRESGFAAAEQDRFDSHFKTVADDPKLPGGVRFALRRRLETYRADLGSRAIAAETEKRAGIVATQERVKLQSRLADATVDFDNGYSADWQGAVEAYDGSDPNFAAARLSAFDEQAKAAVEKADDQLKPLLQASLASKRVQTATKALEVQHTGYDAYVVNGAERRVNALASGVLTNPAGYQSATHSLEEAAELVPGRLRRTFLQEGQAQLAGFRIEGLLNRSEYDQAELELADGRYDGFMPAQMKAKLADELRARASRDATNMIEALTYGGEVDTGRLARLARISGDVGIQAHADWAEAVGGAEAGLLKGGAGALGGRKGFPEAADFVIDQLEGGAVTIGNDNGRGASRFGINQAANPDLDVRNLTRPQAVARYSRYWRAVGASRLPPGLGLAAFDAAVLFGVDDANRWVAESGGDVGKFLALEQTQMERLAASDPGKYGDDLKGWKNRLGKVRDEAARRQAFANVQEGLSTDPIKFALGGDAREPLANVPPLPEDLTGAGFQQALKGRLAVGAYMNREYRAPVRMLTNAEAALIKQEIETDPLRAVTLAEDANAAVGPVAAKALLAEVGQQGQAGVTLHLADLSAAGMASYARQAARGLTLKGQGVQLETKDRQDIEGVIEARRALFAGQPELRVAVTQTAEAAMLADQQSGKPKDPLYYVLGALGGNTRRGRLFGGVAKINGQEAVIPSWLAVDHAEDALEVLGEAWAAQAAKAGKDPEALRRAGPVYSDGTAVPAREIARARLQLLPSGDYRLLDRRGGVLMGRFGQPFSFDLDDARALLRVRLGSDAVAGP